MKTKSTLICLVVAFCTSTCMSVSAQAVNEQDSLALVDLYDSTNGPDWDYNYGWLTGPVTTWYGITVTDTRVTEINLLGNNLNGNIPVSIGNLVNLTYLDLSSYTEEGYFYNHLSGSIPSSIGNLVSLTYLNLYLNQLSDTIPSSLSNLVNLHYLNLSENQLSGIIPSSIGNIAKLETLHLADNQLSGSIPSSIGNLLYLAFLALYNNKLSDNIPSSIGNLTNLFWLGLYGNELSNSIPSSIGNLTNLESLGLGSNRLSGNIPSSIGNLTNLYWLGLSDNQLNGTIPSSLGNLVNLESFYLDNNQLSDSIPSSIGNLMNLYSLGLSNNQLIGSIPSSIGNLINLRELFLNNNQLSGSIPTSFGNLVGLGQLYLNNNQLSGSIPSSISDFLNLWALDLSYNRFLFNGMELIAQTYPNAIYSPQASIPVHQKGNVLSVSAGGTLSNNTYNWYKDGLLDTIIYADSIFQPIVNGNYFVTVTNAIATQLTLYSDTLSTVLPVTLSSFTVTRKENTALLSWQTASEQNNNYFSVQRSTNQNNFNEIGRVKSKGNSAQTQQYTFKDGAPFSGNNYYRLQQVDNDGKFTYSKIVQVNFNNISNIKLFPNPSQGFTTLEYKSNTEGLIQLNIFDAAGKQVFIKTEQATKGSNTYQLNLSNLINGIYNLQIINGTEQSQVKFIIEK